MTSSSDQQQQEITLEIRALRADITERFDQVEKRFDQVEKRFDQVEKRLEKLDTQVTEVKEALKTLDNKFFDFSMRVVSSSSTAYWSVAIALLSAVVAFVVTQITRGVS